MMNTIKMSWSRLTVKIGLAAVILAAVSLFLPWFKRDYLSVSLIDAYLEDSSFFTGVPLVFLVAMLWVALWFLLNHPKLTLVGSVVLLLMWFAFLWFGIEYVNYDIHFSIGFFLYLIAVIGCWAMAFATKKIRPAKRQRPQRPDSGRMA